MTRAACPGLMAATVPFLRWLLSLGSTVQGGGYKDAQAWPWVRVRIRGWRLNWSCEGVNADALRQMMSQGLGPPLPSYQHVWPLLPKNVCGQGGPLDGDLGTPGAPSNILGRAMPWKDLAMCSSGNRTSRVTHSGSWRGGVLRLLVVAAAVTVPGNQELQIRCGTKEMPPSRVHLLHETFLSPRPDTGASPSWGCEMQTK